jgi:glycine hydroxymethyltransferase
LTLDGELRASLTDQLRLLRGSLILNPVENVPFADDIAVTASPLHGLYNSDKVRTREQREVADIVFGGRRAIEEDCRKIYAAWAAALGAEDATLRLLSGLHAHIVLFMAAASPGQSVLLLPVRAGGHVSAQRILERLGLEVVEMAVDDERMCVDMAGTLDRVGERVPDFVFVDRSEGLVVEDFSPLTRLGALSVFDSSQYLTNVIAGDHPNPLAEGFDLLVSSVHKSFPGPQKALIAARKADDRWKQLLAGVSTYVSNMDMTSSYAATLTLARTDWLATYSKRMLACATLLERELAGNGVPVVRRPDHAIPTQHVWVREVTKRKAFAVFEALEQCHILTNLRTLPYSLGPGIRLGLTAAVRIGLDEPDVPRLAHLLADIRRRGATRALRAEASAFSKSIWDRHED